MIFELIETIFNSLSSWRLKGFSVVLRNFIYFSKNIHFIQPQNAPVTVQNPTLLLLARVYSLAELDLVIKQINCIFQILFRTIIPTFFFFPYYRALKDDRFCVKYQADQMWLEKKKKDRQSSPIYKKASYILSQTIQGKLDQSSSLQAFSLSPERNFKTV